MKINRRIKKIFKEHLGSYLGMIILIILATSCYFGLKTATTSIEKNVNESRNQVMLEDVSFHLSNTLTDVEIENIEEKFKITIQEQKQFETNYNDALLRIRPEFEKINKASLLTGNYLREDTDIMVDRFFLDAWKLKIGDKLSVYNKKFTICGTFVAPDYLSLLKSETDFMPDGKKFGLCMVTQAAFEKIKEEETKSYSVLLNGADKEELRKELETYGVVNGWIERESNSRIATFDGEIKAIIMISKVAPIFILIVSTMIMAVVLNRMLKKEYVYIGTLEALGYKKREIISHYLRIPMFISLVGSILGLLLGWFIKTPFTSVVAMEYNIPKIKYYYNWIDIFLVLSLPFILNTIATFISVTKALSINIVSLLKSSSTKVKKGVFTRMIPHKKGSFSMRFKVKEITFNMPRSFLMLFGIIISTIFILSGFMFNGAIDFLFKNNFHETFGYKYQYVLNNPSNEVLVHGEPYMACPFNYEKDGTNYGITIMGTAKNSKYIKLKDLNGKPINENSTVITKSVSKRLKIKAGDVITIRNNTTRKTYALKIDSICDIPYSENVYMPIEKLNDILGFPKDMYVGVYSNEKLNINEDSIRNLFTKEDSEAGMEASIASMSAVLYVLAFIAAAIATVVIYIVTIMLVEENRKIFLC